MVRYFYRRSDTLLQAGDAKRVLPFVGKGQGLPRFRFVLLCVWALAPSRGLALW